MHHLRFCLCVCLPGLALASRSAVLPRLHDALTSSARPLLVELLDAGPVDTMDTEEVSTSCRTAGAAALLLPQSLLAPFASEQSLAEGSFPGPLPLVCDLRESDLAAAAAQLTDLRSSGASAVAVAAAALSDAEMAAGEFVAAARKEDLEVLALASGAGDGAAAEAAGACAVVYDEVAAALGASESGAASAGADGDGAVVRLACWEGDEESLYELREQASARLALRLHDHAKRRLLLRRRVAPPRLLVARAAAATPCRAF